MTKKETRHSEHFDKLSAPLVSESENIETPYELPKGWKWEKLGDIFEMNPKIKADDELSASFVSMEKIEANHKNVFSFSIEQWGKIRKGHTQFQNGDVCFAKISPCFENGKAFIAQGLENGIGAGTTELVVLRNKNIDSNYTFYFISTEKFIRKGCTTYSGTVGQQRISMDFVKNIPFPLPPTLAEQQRIVNRIESMFAKLDQAQEKAQTVLDSFETRKAAILHKAFTGELTANWRKANNPEESSEYLNKIKDKVEIRLDFKYWNNPNLPDSWCESTIGNLLYFAGRVGWKGLKAEEYTTEGPILLSVYNLNDGDEVSFNRINHITNERYDESPEIMVRKNDILLTKDGAGIGKLGYVKELPEKATINSSLLLIRPGDVANYKFIYYLLSGPALQNIVKERITGSATPHLFQRDIKEFVLPVPSLPEQQEIVRILDTILEKESRAKEAALAVLEKTAILKKSILARAFRGEL